MKPEALQPEFLPCPSTGQSSPSHRSTKADIHCLLLGLRRCAAVDLLSRLKQGFFHPPRVYPSFDSVITFSLEKAPAWRHAKACRPWLPVSSPPVPLFTATPSLTLGLTHGISCPLKVPFLTPEAAVSTPTDPFSGGTMWTEACQGRVSCRPHPHATWTKVCCLLPSSL